MGLEATFENRSFPRNQSTRKEGAVSTNYLPAMALVAKEEDEKEYAIKPENIGPVVDTSSWPLLLKNYDKLFIRTGHFTPIPLGCTPLKRDLRSYISSGVINLDKPSNPSSHEVVAWVKRMLRFDLRASTSFRLCC